MTRRAPAARISRARLAAGLLVLIFLAAAMIPALTGCAVHASDERPEEHQSSPNISASDNVETVGFPVVHIIGLTLPEEYGYGFLDCEAAFWIVNHLRELEGLEPLGRTDAVFQQATVERLDEITVRFSHTRPNGEKYSTVFAEHNIVYAHSNENLACGQFTAEHVMHDWLESDTHKANLLDPDIDRVCIACRLDADGVPYWVFEGVRYAKDNEHSTPDYTETSSSDYGYAPAPVIVSGSDGLYAGN